NGSLMDKLNTSVINTNNAEALSAMSDASSTSASDCTYHKYTGKVPPCEKGFKSHISPEVPVPPTSNIKADSPNALHAARLTPLIIPFKAAGITTFKMVCD